MPKIPDLVVLLPGISGSVLAKDGREVWGTTSGAITRAVLTRGDSIRELLMQGDDASLDDLVTSVKLVEI